MARPDIYLGRNKTTVVDRMDIATGRDEEPTIKLSPSRSNALLGGGTGDDADGDLYLLARAAADRGEGPPSRIQLSAGGGNSFPRRNRVFVAGDDGRVDLGEKSTATGEDREWDIRLFPRFATAHLGGGAGENSDGDLKLSDREADERVHLDAGGGGPSDPSTTRAYLDGTAATFELGDSERTGRIALRGEEPRTAEGAVLTGDGDLTLGGIQDGGTVTLERGHSERTERGRRTFDDDPGIVLDGGSGEATLGGSGAVGRLRVERDETTAIDLDADSGAATVGGGGVGGGVLFENADGEPVGELSVESESRDGQSDDALTVTTFEDVDGGQPTRRVAMRIFRDGTVEFPQND